MGKEDINAFLGAGTVYTGKLQFDGAVRIDGRFIGEICSDGVLLVGKDANIEGEIHTGELILAGTFAGKAETKRRTTIHKTGILRGELNTPCLAVEDGGILDAQLHMSPDTENQTGESSNSNK